MSNYRHPALRLLAEQQMRYSPRDVRLQQVERAERLAQRVDLQAEFPWQKVCQEVTSYRPDSYPDLQISGSDLLHDLRVFIEDLSESIELRPEQVDEEVLTVEDVSRQYNVSTKTVDRWRDRGLISRKFLYGGRKRVAFLRSSVDRFVEANHDDIERGSSFRQVTDEERRKILARARRLARFGAGATEINNRLGRRFHRSPETIRLMLKDFDRGQPEIALFPDSTDVLSIGEREEIYAAYHRGLAVEDLAIRFKRTKSSLYRTIAEVRARHLLSQSIDFMDSPEFYSDTVRAAMQTEVPPPVTNLGVTKPPPGLPPYLASLYSTPLLTREQEAYYFRRMNFLKSEAVRLRKGLSLAQPRVKLMDEIDDRLEKATEIKNFLIRSNLRLVVSIAKKHAHPSVNFFEMISDGNMSLIKAIEKFDYTRGFKFSTYASWAIMKNFARSIPAENTRLDRFRTGSEDVFVQSMDPRTDQFRDEVVNHRQHEALMGILGQLETRERDIIVHRYGLEAGQQPQTLEQVGHRFGVTKERIRQIEARALKKLKKIATEERLDIPGI